MQRFLPQIRERDGRRKRQQRRARNKKETKKENIQNKRREPTEEEEEEEEEETKVDEEKTPRRHPPTTPPLKKTDEKQVERRNEVRASSLTLVVRWSSSRAKGTTPRSTSRPLLSTKMAAHRWGPSCRRASQSSTSSTYHGLSEEEQRPIVNGRCWERKKRRNRLTLEVLQRLLETEIGRLHQRGGLLGAPVEDVAGHQVGGQRRLAFGPRQFVQAGQVGGQQLQRSLVLQLLLLSNHKHTHTHTHTQIVNKLARKSARDTPKRTSRPPPSMLYCHRCVSPIVDVSTKKTLHTTCCVLFNVRFVAPPSPPPCLFTIASISI